MNHQSEQNTLAGTSEQDRFLSKLHLMTPFLHLNHVDVNQCQQLGFAITSILVFMKTSLCINILANRMVWLPTLIFKTFLAHIFLIAHHSWEPWWRCHGRAKTGTTSCCCRAVLAEQSAQFNKSFQMVVDHLQLMLITLATAAATNEEIATVGSVFLYHGARWSKAVKIRSVCVN